jgi:hypothetical protein
MLRQSDLLAAISFRLAVTSFLPATINPERRYDTAGSRARSTFGRGQSPVKTTSGKSNTGEPVRLFASQKAWQEWLEKKHRKSTGLWLRLAKKGFRLEFGFIQRSLGNRSLPRMDRRPEET